MEFTFPKIAKKLTIQRQLEKILEELEEVREAKTAKDIDEEIIDLYHAVETLVRIRFQARPLRLRKIINFVIRKNLKRGYYGT